MEEYKIYRIVCNETNEVYFGKTTQTLQERLYGHRDNSHSYTSKQIILRGDYYIEQIDSTFDEKESIRLERYYIETFDCVNLNVPGRTKKEYMKKWREENVEYLKKYEKAIYTCECGSTLTVNHKARHERTQKHINFINSK